MNAADVLIDPPTKWAHLIKYTQKRAVVLSFSNGSDFVLQSFCAQKIQIKILVF